MRMRSHLEYEHGGVPSCSTHFNDQPHLALVHSQLSAVKRSKPFEGVQSSGELQGFSGIQATQTGATWACNLGQP